MILATSGCMTLIFTVQLIMILIIHQVIPHGRKCFPKPFQVILRNIMLIIGYVPIPIITLHGVFVQGMELVTLGLGLLGDIFRLRIPLIEKQFFLMYLGNNNQPLYRFGTSKN